MKTGTLRPYLSAISRVWLLFVAVVVFSFFSSIPETSKASELKNGTESYLDEFLFATFGSYLDKEKSSKFLRIRKWKNPVIYAVIGNNKNIEIKIDELAQKISDVSRVEFNKLPQEWCSEEVYCSQAGANLHIFVLDEHFQSSFGKLSDFLSFYWGENKDAYRKDLIAITDNPPCMRAVNSSKGRIVNSYIVITTQFGNKWINKCIASRLFQVMGFIGDGTKVKDSILDWRSNFEEPTNKDYRLLELLYKNFIKPYMTPDEVKSALINSNK